MNEGSPGRPSDVYSRYGVQRRSEVQTGQQVQEQVNAEMQVRYGPFIGVVLGVLQAPGRVDDMLDAQAAQLKGQVLTRSAPPQPDAHYIGIPHQQLHDSVNNGVDPGAIGEIGDIWTQIGNELATFNDDVAAAIGDSETNWTGKAADGARQALATLGNRAGETGTAAQLAGTLFTQQSRALSDAKNTVPPPPAQPYDAAASRERLMSITDPIQFAQQAAADKAAFQQQQADHEQAARAVETYDRTVAQTAAAQPAFAPEPPAPPKDPVDPGRPPIAPDPGFTSQGNTPPPPQVGNDTTTPSWTAPPTQNPGTTNTSGLNNNLGGNGPNLGNQGGSNNQLGGNNVTLGGGPFPDTKTTQGGPGGRTGGGPGVRSSGGGVGVGSGRLPGSGIALGNPNAAKGFGPGGSAGVMPGNEGTTGRGGATSAGAAGRGGAAGGAMGGMGTGAAKGKGDEDIERTSPSYLLEPDPDDIFGNDMLVAPPVLGE